VDHLAQASDPNLVIMIHGFNNPRKVVLDRYASAFDAVNQDPAIANRRGLVCIGYRWPSERIGTPLWTAFSAAPKFLIGLLLVGVLLLGLAPGLGMFSLAISITAILLYIVVYFRDGYRAISYGIPDLVDIIRQIDKKLTDKEDRSGERRNWVELSFIGHSMGAYVVTSVVRILSDVFAPASVKPGLHVGVAGTDGISDAMIESERPPPEISKIGNVFRLMRLLLVSPDIPTETLVSNRVNFLASSLSRFEEAYLFSNEGDEVLRQISATANYFSFPTRNRNFGYRLGNVGVRAKSYGIVGHGTAWGLDSLRIGDLTLQEIYRRLSGSSGAGQLQDELPRYFTYFDCTDYVDTVQGVLRGVLTLAKPGVPNRMGLFFDRLGLLDRLKLSLDHLKLLLHAAILRWPDVHGGYFDAAFSGQLIYRLICLGFRETVQAYDDVGTLSAECGTRQIKSLLSPRLSLRELKLPIHTLTTPPPPPPPPPTGDIIPHAVIIPNVCGLTLQEARANLEAIEEKAVVGDVILNKKNGPAGLFQIQVKEQVSDQPPGTVLSQSLAAGETVRYKGEDITIELTVAMSPISELSKA
jgi:hypothetical protein